MSIEKHISEFLTALNGSRGSLDAWLECNNEAECRDAMLGAMEQLRAEVAALAEQNGKMREVISELVELESDIRDGIHDSFTFQPARQSLSLPELATPAINRIKAEGMREAAEICHCISLQRVGTAIECKAALRAKADELEGKTNEH